MRAISGGFLVQDADVSKETRDQMKVVTKAKPTEDQWRDLLFAWRVCKHVRSNAMAMRLLSLVAHRSQPHGV